MNKALKNSSSGFILLVFLVFCWPHSGYAEEEHYLLEADIYSALTVIHQDIENGDHGAALEKLNKLIALKTLSDYATAVIYQTMGYAKNGQGHITDAANHFIKALSLNALPKEVTHQLHFTTAQLLIHSDNPEKGIHYLSIWFKHEPEPTAENHILAATAYYHLKDYEHLITHAKQAISFADKPELNWYKLLLLGYFETKHYKNAALVLEQILLQYPNKTAYWLQLAGVYQHLNNAKKALAIYELAYTKGLLKEKQLLPLVKNYLYLKMPYKAATVLEKEMAAGNIKKDKEILHLLADSWLLARENNLAKQVLTEIIDTFNDDQARLQLGQLYFESEQWQAVIKTLDNTLASSADNAIRTNANLLLGIAQYHADDLAKATRAFTQALADESTLEQAQWWLKQLKKKTQLGTR